MATKELITKVWIEEGCIVCDACETSSPTVFEVTDDTCVIRPDALNPEFTKPLTDSIAEAAEECPVDVIKFETVAGEVADAPASAEADAKADAVEPAPEPESKPAPKAPATPAVAASKPAEKKPVGVGAGAPDPAIQSLLRAATARGGVAMISKPDAGATPAVKALQSASAKDLPPDAQQARVLSASKKASRDGEVSRRGVLAGSACGVGWLALGGSTAISGLAFQRFLMPNVLEEPDPRVRVGPVDVYASMNPGEVNEDTKPDGFWIIRTENSIAALNIICTHLGCIPNWLPNDRKFKCPCHGSGFYPDGINFEGPAPRPLERFRISLADGIVSVDRSKKFQWEKGEWDNPDSYVEV